MTKRNLSEAPEGVRGCPCGEDHSSPHRRRVWRKPNPELSGKLMAAQWAGKAHQEPRSGIWHVEYHADCKSPPVVPQHSPEGRLARYKVRCRKCGPCRRAMRNYWGYAAMQQTLLSAAEGGRTWFGTLTLAPEMQVELLLRARKRSKVPDAEWWQVADCEERYRRVCDEFLREVQKYWKRLRNDGHVFKYLAVFEPHKSGKPHCHFLLHELQGDHILKRELRDRWPNGFIAATLVGGRAAKSPDPAKAAWYAVKYLSKCNQSRVRASHDYRPSMRAKPHSCAKSQRENVEGAPNDSERETIVVDASSFFEREREER